MRELRQQLTNALLMIITVAVVVAAAINFQQQSKFHTPDDGVTWIDRQVAGESVPVATYVAPGSPAEKAGIHMGDSLVSIDGLRIGRAEEAAEVLARLGTWHKAGYKIMHGGTEVPAPVIVGEVTRDSTLYYQYAVGVLYLGIGLFVYFRRGSAPRALHFFPAVSRLVRFVDLPLHRKTEQLRQGHLPGQCHGLVPGADAIPALLLYVP